MSLDFDMPQNSARHEKPKAVTERLYVCSRDNIDLKGAQDITVHAAIHRPDLSEYLITDKRVDLVWCSAYPDSIFGEIPLPSLLMGYIERSEGDQYLKKSSPVIPVEGEINGYEYYIIILVRYA